MNHHRMSNEQLAEHTLPQRNRLAFVALRVRFIGERRHQDLVSRFGIKNALLASGYRSPD